MPVGGSVGPLHAQSQDNACGPACCAMVLDWARTLGSSSGAGLDESSLLECLSEVDAQGHQQWATANRITSYLNLVLPATGRGSYELVMDKSPASLTHQLIWSLKSGAGPAIVQTEASNHWVTVFGYCVDRVPQTIDDHGYTVRGLFVSNPAAYPGGEPVHRSGDCCPRASVSEAWVGGGGWEGRLPLINGNLTAVLVRATSGRINALSTPVLARPGGGTVQDCRDEGRNVLGLLDGTELGARFPVSASAPGEPEYVLVERWRGGCCVALIETGDGDDGEEIRAVAPVPPEHPWSRGIRVPSEIDLRERVEAGLRDKGIDLPAQGTIRPRLIRPLSGPARSRFAPQLEVKVGGGGFLDHLHHRALLEGPGFDEITLVE